jgi:hypothetical protein
MSEPKPGLAEWNAVYEALEALSKSNAAIRLDLKIRFLDSSRLEYTFRNPAYDKRGRKIA